MKKDIHLIIIIISLLLAAGAISSVMIFALGSGKNGAEKSVRGTYSVKNAPDACFKVSLPGEITYRSGEESETPYGIFTPIDSVMEMNAYMTMHPVVYGEDACIECIVPDGDIGRAAEIMARIYELADEICSGCDDDRSKAEALALWTGKNLIYDHDMTKGTVDYNITSLQAIFENDYHTTCGGFANFYSALCHSQGIYCLNMKGGTSSGGWYRKDLEAAPANHEWNAVVIDGEWYYTDCTWISDLESENGELTGGEDIKPFYALFGFEEMSIEHRIDRCEHRCYSIIEAVDKMTSE